MVVLSDSLPEADEVFFVDVTYAVEPSTGTVLEIVKSRGVGTILDNDTRPDVSINDVALPEGPDGYQTLFPFVVALSEPAPESLTVWYRLPGAQSSLMLDFSPGQISRTIEVPVTGDDLAEPDETFFVDLTQARWGSSGPYATLARSRGIGTILDDDTLPSVSINDVTLPEGPDGYVTPFTFTVTLSEPAPQSMTVAYRTPESETNLYLGFSPGETSKTIIVPISGDPLPEPDQTFFVDLRWAQASGRYATITRSRGVGTILDDDTLPTVSIDDVTQLEGPAGATTPMVFTVSLSRPAAAPTEVRFVVSEGSAAAEEDFQYLSSYLIFNPGEQFRTIAVTVHGDDLPEPDETFSVRLWQADAARIADGEGVGTMLNDDGGDLDVSIDDVVQLEGADGATGSFVFTVALSEPSPWSLPVNFMLGDGTAQR